MKDALLVTFGGIAALAVLAVLSSLRRRNMSKGTSRAKAAAAVNAYRNQRDKADLGLMCPSCGALAEPMGDTHDHYLCIGCRHQFTAEQHEWKTK
jgi:DNA-directed RNA polymerase subunit RPC12/RpoP